MEKKGEEEDEVDDERKDEDAVLAVLFIASKIKE